MNNIIKSPNLNLIWQDVESTLISFMLIAGPIIIVEVLDILSKMEKNVWIESAAIFLGLVLKLLQKWQANNFYQNK